MQLFTKHPGFQGKKGLCLRLGLYVIFAGLACSFCLAASDPTAPSKSFSVPEIRFGRIEPPVVAQEDITVRAATSNQQFEEKPLECSGLAWFDGHLIISSDRHEHLLFTCPVDLDTLTFGPLSPQVIIHNEQMLLNDAECITLKPQADGSVNVYVMCSLSNDSSALPLPMRQHILRFNLSKVDPFTFKNHLVLRSGTIRTAVNEHFEAIGIKPYYTYYENYPGDDKNTYRWANIEGVCFIPNSSLVLCGFRNPLFDNKALVTVVEGFEQAFNRKDPAAFEVKDLFTLDLGDRGISDISWDPLTQGYLITAAKSNGPWLDKNQAFPPDQLDGALFWWNGNKTDKPILCATFPDLTVEAVCRLGNSRFIAVGSDEGDVSERRAQRQSILTIMDFPGVGHYKVTAHGTGTE